MKAFKYIVAIVVAVPLLFFLIGMSLPEKSVVERELEIDAPVDHVFFLASQYKQFHRWSPWKDLDPNMEVVFSGPLAGVGSMMEWRGNQQVGQGSSVVTVYNPHEYVEMSLDFGAMGGGTASFTVTELDVERSKVVWRFETANRNVMERYAGLFLDGMLGPVYEQGLAALEKLAVNLDPVVEETVLYSVNDVLMHGYLTYPVGVLDPVPGVVIVHGIWGQTEHEREVARKLARSGYAAFALDLYGGGVATDQLEVAINMMDVVGDNSDLTVSVFDAAKESFESHYLVDEARIGAIGYSVGGSIALNMARRGKNLSGVAAYYAGLSGLADIADNAFTPVVIFSAENDHFGDQDQRTAFVSEMESANLAFDIVDYEGAQHGFANPLSATYAEKAEVDFLQYNPEAEVAAWEKLIEFLNDSFY